MSATVMYKGVVKGTVENATKKLDVKGTYMEDDITIVDETSSGGEVLVVDTPDSHGGTIREITAQNTVSLQEVKNYTLTTSHQTIIPDTGYDGFRSVEVTSEVREDLTDPKDVDFIDYDGRLVYSYTVAEFLELTELPPNPINPGLVAQGWNWTLADAKEYVAQWGALVVGQSYTTDTGRSRLYLTVSELQISRGVKHILHFGATEATSIKVYWGDGTINTYNMTSTLYCNPTKIYNTAGKYIVEIEVISGSLIFGYQYSNSGVIGNASSENGNDSRQPTSLTKVEIGDGVSMLGNQPFRACINLQTISMPIGITGIINYNGPGPAFETLALKAAVFPSGFQGRPVSMFTYNSNLKYVSLPKSTTSFQIGTSTKLRKFTIYELNNVTSSTIKLAYSRVNTHVIIPGNYTTLVAASIQSSYITKFTVPETVTRIETEALMYNYFMIEIHLLPETPPTLVNVRALQGLNSQAIIYVPYSEDHSILAAYQAATNWSTYASKMQEEPQS